jgi:hypothetical protein
MVRTVANTGLGGLSFLFFLLQNFYGKLGEVTMGARVVGGPEPPPDPPLAPPLGKKYIIL